VAYNGSVLAHKNNNDMTQNRLFLGWQVLAASVIGLACCIATLFAATFSVFLGPMRLDLGWSQSEAFSAVMLVSITAATSAPIIGLLVDRLGAKPVILFSFFMQVLIYASFYFQTTSLWSFYLRYTLLASLAFGTSHVAFVRVITLWFDRRRGLALGIALSGVGIGGVLWPLYTQLMIDLVGWRLAYVALAVAVAVVAFPVVGGLLRDSPASIGQTSDGEPSNEQKSAGTMLGLTLRQAIRTRRYWLMVVTFFLIGFAVQSIMMHLVPLLTSRGLSPMLAAIAQSMLFFSVTTGRLTTGWLMDRFFAPRVAVGFLIAPIIGVVFLALGASGILAFTSALLVGLAVGAEIDVLAYLSSRYFGSKNFSLIYGTFYGVYSLSGGAGPLITALLVEKFDGYTIPLFFLLGILIASISLLFMFEKFPKLNHL